MSLVGFPWTDGGSLIHGHLNDTSSHTTLRLHNCVDYQIIGSSYEGANPDDPSWIRGSGAAFLPMSGMSIVLNADLPATTSWALDMNYDIEHEPGGSGSSVFRTYFNGAWWDDDVGSTFVSVNTSTGFKNEDVYGVGTGTVWLYAQTATPLGSAGCREVQWRFKQARVVPVW